MFARYLNQAVFLLAAGTLATTAQASYGQMRLDGIGLLLAFALVVAYGVIVDLALLARLFRYRAVLFVGQLAALAVIALLVGLAAAPGERAGFFKGAPGGAALVVLVVTGAVFIPFIAFAPLAQYRAMRQGRRWPRWVGAGMVLQLALLPAFLALDKTEEHFWQQEFAAGRAVGRETGAGGLGAIRDRAEQRRERIWGTGWAVPWHQEPPTGRLGWRSGWIAGLAQGLDDAALIAANEALSEPDRKALGTLIESHFAGFAMPKVRTKLLWDALEPGDFARQLAPHGLKERGVVSEELIPLLLERLEAYGEVRLCPGGRMVDADRVLLNQLVLAKLHDYDEARQRDRKAALDARQRDREMAEAPMPLRLVWNAAHSLGAAYGGQDVEPPDWSAYPQRVEQLCRGPRSDPPVGERAP